MPDQKTVSSAPNGGSSNRAGHICMICGFIPTTKNKYRELQDHLVRKHFNERIKAALPTKRPYMCPEPSCTIEGKDWQALMRHYTGKHGVLERYLREIIEAGLDDAVTGGDLKNRKVSTKSRLNPNGTAPAIQLPPEQIEQMQKQALEESAAQKRFDLTSTSALAALPTQPAAPMAPPSGPLPPPPQIQIQTMQSKAAAASRRRKRTSRNSTGSVSSPESLPEDDDCGGLAPAASAAGITTPSESSVLYHQSGGAILETQPYFESDKEHPQLALVFKRPKMDPNGEDAYAFIDLKSFLASSTYVPNAADLLTQANDNVKFGVLATPLSPPPEKEEDIELPKISLPPPMQQPQDLAAGKSATTVQLPQQPLPPAQQNQPQTQVVYASQEHHQQQFQMQQQQQQAGHEPPPITGTTVSTTSTPTMSLSAASGAAPPPQVLESAMAAATSSPVPSMSQEQQQQPIIYSTSVEGGQHIQFQDIQLADPTAAAAAAAGTTVLIPPTQELPAHVQQEMIQSVVQTQQQQQQQHNMVIQQGASEAEPLGEQGAAIIYAPAQPAMSTEHFSLSQQPLSQQPPTGSQGEMATVVLSAEELQQIFYLEPAPATAGTTMVSPPVGGGGGGGGGVGGAAAVAVSFISPVALPTEPINIADIEQQQQQQQQPGSDGSQELSQQPEQKVVVEQVGALPPVQMAAAVTDGDLSEQVKAEVKEEEEEEEEANAADGLEVVSSVAGQTAQGGSADEAARAATANAKKSSDGNLQEVKEIDFSMF